MFHHYRKHTFTFEKTIGSTRASNLYHFKAASDIASMKVVILLSIFAMFPLLISLEVTYMHFCRIIQLSYFGIGCDDFSVSIESL